MSSTKCSYITYPVIAVNANDNTTSKNLFGVYTFFPIFFFIFVQTYGAGVSVNWIMH